MSEKEILLTIVLMSVVTMAPRVAPLVLVGRRELPAGLRSWLHYVPAAVLSAMIAPELLLVRGEISLGLGNVYLWSVLPTAFVAWRTRNLCLTVVVGMGMVAVARLLGG